MHVRRRFQTDPRQFEQHSRYPRMMLPDLYLANLEARRPANRDSTRLPISAAIAIDPYCSG